MKAVGAATAPKRQGRGAFALAGFTAALSRMDAGTGARLGGASFVTVGTVYDRRVAEVGAPTAFLQV